MQKECRERHRWKRRPKIGLKNAQKYIKFQKFFACSAYRHRRRHFFNCKGYIFQFLRKNTNFVIFQPKNARKGVKFRKFSACGAYRHRRHHSLILIINSKGSIFFIFEEKNTKFVIFRNVFYHII